jgi:uncharacterized repeat protein (TIGR02543 family)
MGRRVAWLAAGLVIALALGVGSAGGHSLVTKTVTVVVMGKGRVKSSPNGIKCGDGDKQCFSAFTSGGTITLTASNTASGWTFESWNDQTPGGMAGGCNLDTTSTCDITGTEDHVVTANFVKSSGTSTSTLTVSFNDPALGGTGTVTGPFQQHDSGNTIDCGSEPNTFCSWTVVTGSTLTVFETPNGGDIFSGWAGDCDGTGIACTVEMNGNRTVNATFAESSAATTTLTVSISGNGSVKGGNVDCSGPSTCTETEPVNETVTLTATPKDGYVFTGWTGTASCSGTGPTCTVTMDVARTVTATFTAAVQLTVEVSGNGNVSNALGAINCGNGAIVCSASLAVGTTVTLIATPATGATFAGWTGACGGTGTTCTVSMTASRSVTATFTGGAAAGGATVALSVSVFGNGTVTGGGIRCGNTSTVCTANQVPNAVVTLIATPDAGATFTGWGGACVGTSTCTVTMTTAKSVTATFTGGSAPSFQLAVTVTGRGSVRGGAISCGNGLNTCGVSVAPNTTLTLTATPAAGARFIRWGGACAGTRTTCTLTVTAAMSVTATFSGGTTGGGGPSAGGTLTALGRPLVRRSATGFLVTLRFRTAVAGTARVRGTRAGRLVTSLAVRVPAGSATIGPFPVAKPGLFTFEVRIGTRALRWRTCLGLCGAAAKAPPFILTRETPAVTRTGVVWSVTLRFRANAISDAHIAVRRSGKLLSDHHFLAGARQIIVGPFLLGPGNYTLTLRAVDAYGRVRTLTWIVALAP